jgi:capsular polysaccharide transport system permease protein
MSLANNSINLNVLPAKRHAIVFAQNHPLIALAVVASLLSALYWWVLASDRYVSEARIMVQRTDLPGGQSMDFDGVLTGILGGANHADQLMLRDYLTSVDMLQRLDSQLALKKHYSDSSRDLFSRLWRDEIEWFRKYFYNRTQVLFDDRSGVLVVKAEAYDPSMAQKIIRTLVNEGDHFVNGVAHDLAQDQVRFLEGQVAQMKGEVLRTRQAVIAYQNQTRLISPQAAAESLSGVLAQLEAKRVELNAQRTALASYLVSNHPSIVQLDQQVAAIEKQIVDQKAKLAAPGGKGLNRKVEEYQRLEIEAGFAQGVYQTALTALERGRVEAARKIKKVIVLQAPTLPEYPDQPRRSYNVLVSVLITFLIAGIVHLILAIISEHKD